MFIKLDGFTKCENIHSGFGVLLPGHGGYVKKAIVFEKTFRILDSRFQYCYWPQIFMTILDIQQAGVAKIFHDYWPSSQSLRYGHQPGDHGAGEIYRPL
jgi:hypothetical protein